MDTKCMFLGHLYFYIENFVIILFGLVFYQYVVGSSDFISVLFLIYGLLIVIFFGVFLLT